MSEQVENAGPPWRVLAIRDEQTVARWWIYQGHRIWWPHEDDGERLAPWSYELTAVDHPRNDPEAIALITTSREDQDAL